jgi:peptidoglycan hydrolase-like protein with peptidoglycan-binding domain
MLGTVVALVAGAAASVWALSGATLGADAAALAHVHVQLFGGTIESARAVGPDGRAIPVTLAGGRLTPRVLLRSGERVSVDVVVRRPGWIAWALGKEDHEHLVLQTPVAHVRDRWPVVASGTLVRVDLDQPVSAVAFGRGARRAVGPTSSLSISRRADAGSVEVATAVRPWERLAAPVVVTWFPRSRSPVVVSTPSEGTRLAAGTPIRLTFSQPVGSVIGGANPKLVPATPGRWRRTDAHTVEFVPAALGVDLASDLHVRLPRAVSVVRRAGHGLRSTRRLDWAVPAGSLLRLQQLLADAGYLPVAWTPDAGPVERTARAELRAAFAPPKGRFDWRYPNVPAELRALWTPGQPNQITRGAVMMFEQTHDLAVDGIAGADVWRRLLLDTLAGKRRTDGYSYVFVHRDLPQSLNLWHDGRVILSSPGNTGVPAAPTKLGTFPVFEHIPVGTMSGTNPDGTHYHDPGIRYISYFNGGDAIHAFNRASFGTPQSLGCVELPLASAAKVWPYTPIGTLVTIEH